ncbi:hypothetical protein BKA58DRAFT_466114 [Alternaria rosae]|uniref:uncharacterized protein n=1 Tax=Alternaria rosae TaxID=1187941 RepID=UPI001E8D74E2|nr:uncharacterized protein BKA58DRAFT_466114 [Alternaria rosae]KAH6878431.1 hypothetical protein BKA58DRAFT_466114 [Alternaria rosae]
MPANYSLHAIPIYWVIALYPHAYSQGLFKAATNGQRNNTNPRGTSTLEHYRKCTPEAIYAEAERAEACHQNSMENAPFFIGAVLAGNAVGLDVATMNTMVASYIGLRLVYSILYVKIKTNKTSYLRSGTWGAGVAVLMTMFVKAGNKMNRSFGL